MVDARRVSGSRGHLWVSLAWASALVLVLMWPLLTQPGHPLARDLVFLPEMPLSWSNLGLSDASPRAVPLDAVVATLTAVVDGGVLARLVLPGFLLLASAGLIRLARPHVGLLGLLVVSGAAVWNPFVVERLALGQWALLGAYAALPWLVAAATRYERDLRIARLAPLAGWAALASLTPTGGVITVALLALRVVLRRAGAWQSLAVAVLLQAPWIVAGVLNSASQVSDPAGVRAFAPDTESRWGPVVALLGLGGIWDSRSEPASRLGPLGLLTCLVVVLVVVLAGRRLWHVLDDSAELAILAGAGLVWALLLTTDPGRSVAVFLVERLPGAGLLRDGQKYLLPLTLLVVLAAGLATDNLVRGLRRWWPDATHSGVAIFLPLILVPLLVLPDGARLVWRTVDPVELPDSFAAVDRATKQSSQRLVTLPWRAYRNFGWGHGLTSSDPATRYLGVEVISSDSLRVGEVVVPGEGALSGKVGNALASGRPASSLGAFGIGWVLVYLDDPAVDELDLGDLGPAVYADEHVKLFAVPDATAPEPHPRASRVALLVAYGVPMMVLVVLLGAWVAAGLGAWAGGSRRVRSNSTQSKLIE